MCELHGLEYSLAFIGDESTNVQLREEILLLPEYKSLLNQTLNSVDCAWIGIEFTPAGWQWANHLNYEYRRNWHDTEDWPPNRDGEKNCAYMSLLTGPAAEWYPATCDKHKCGVSICEYIPPDRIHNPSE